MAAQLTGDALTRGELQFARVETFNADTLPDADSINARCLSYYGDGSRDMTGIVRLMDGTRLPFAYVDGRFAIREDDGTVHFDEEGYSPAKGARGMSWPFEGYIVMVEVEEGRIRRWTWPGVVLGSAYGVRDHRYLVAPKYDGKVQFPGLHCLVDITQLPSDVVQEMIGGRNYNFPPEAVYVGHHADDFLSRAPVPHAYAVFGWNRELGESYLVSMAAKLA